MLHPKVSKLQSSMAVSNAAESQERRDVGDGTFELQPVLKAKDFQYMLAD